MEQIEEMAGEEGLLSANQRIAKSLAENRRKESEFDKWLTGEFNKSGKRNL